MKSVLMFPAGPVSVQRDMTEVWTLEGSMVGAGCDDGFVSANFINSFFDQVEKKSIVTMDMFLSVRDIIGVIIRHNLIHVWLAATVLH